ncbi:hypothetical protein ASPVEDRAFT_875524 [Aspergillus versicolor CBS 583.65]|uniref:Uncharacterized protein n=1 Tax=Aspergillus versicolor CBS 583.65 TaxID=1036611 RepID=A0A1L9PYE0_ASPVE|nr:uncharacterized protein ASPVEDRAFT_875524 [Aspergillus versicolor CBS 583.65]OJJ06483.1 hypothetical protein ASPVEDRAFT_875524 [Aspergillus versicolor CBS 583.65]
MAQVHSSPFDEEFYSLLAELQPSSSFKWYQTAIVALGALNYPEEIPKLYKILLDAYIPKEIWLEETRKIREGLTKACGIMGAAKTGSSLRQLATAIPPELMESTYHRAGDTQETAFKRGRKMFFQIYGNIPGYDEGKTLHASPDYYHIVNVLDILETEQVIVSALLGIDCPEQAKNHIVGILANGGRDEDLQFIRDIVSRIADRGHVQLRRVSKFETPRLDSSN